ncbi:hypothetical protein [Neobacillus sp. DY30]|uniref:hypothetical protein n=1 Tax=Neobacillus sp. DY30 TaxID=3047871 RepID=UPI0024C02E00|nr:hypothetical protein [Neobacillus sp. DY30]WHY00654.1 hypothetical protein QNH29_29740 [Neobacillus sp. DY30]
MSKHFTLKELFDLKDNQNAENAAVEANIKINKQLEDGEVHAPIQAQSEADRANIELQNQFNNNENKDIRTSPAAISTPQ